MANWYGSFLLRYWRRDCGVERIEIEHIQSGERTRVVSLAAAVAWIHTRGADTAIPADPPPVRTPEHRDG
jgi:hypothetical protein